MNINLRNLIKIASSITLITSLLLLWGIFEKINILGVDLEKLLQVYELPLFFVSIFSLPFIFLRKHETESAKKPLPNTLIEFFGLALIPLLITLWLYLVKTAGMSGNLGLSYKLILPVIITLGIADILYLYFRKH